MKTYRLSSKRSWYTSNFSFRTFDRTVVGYIQKFKVLKLRTLTGSTKFNKSLFNRTWSKKFRQHPTEEFANFGGAFEKSDFRSLCHRILSSYTITNIYVGQWIITRCVWFGRCLHFLIRSCRFFPRAGRIVASRQAASLLRATLDGSHFQE